MIRIGYSHEFVRAYEKLPAVLQEEVKEKLRHVPDFVRYVVWLGVILTAFAQLWLTLLAFRENPRWGLIVLFGAPIGGLIFASIYFRDFLVLLQVYVAGLLMVSVPPFFYHVSILDFIL